VLSQALLGENVSRRELERNPLRLCQG
jgi:hypothetical protein